MKKNTKNKCMRGVRVFSAMQECTLEIVLVCIKPKQDGKEYFLEVCCFILSKT